MSGFYGIAIVFVFLAVNLIVGLVRKSKGAGSHNSAEEFVLGARKLSPFVLFATMAATNFSAFTVFGLSGAGYRLGWSYLPVMAFGTGFMAFAFIFIGIPVRRMAALKGWMTQSDLIKDRYGSLVFARAVSAMLILFTLPYITAQIVAGGRMIADMAGIPYPLAAASIAFVTLAYVLAGGMRSVARTDVLQLAILVGGCVAAFIVIRAFQSNAFPGVSASAPLTREGSGPGVSFGSYAGFILLWFLADPMFPQLFQRFIGARDDRSIILTARLYPLITTALFFCTVGIGVLGAIVMPGLDRASSERIFTLLTLKVSGGVAAVAFGLAALAALMSTLDSQILSLASMLDRDWRRREGSSTRRVRIAALFVVLISFLAALNPPASILDFLNATAFPGYAAIGVVFLAALYIRKSGIIPACAAFFAGMLVVLLEAAGIFKAPGPHPIFFNCFVQTLFFAGAWIVERVFPHSTVGTLPDEIRQKNLQVFFIAFVILVLGLDFWNYGQVALVILGLPSWLWYHLALALVLSFSLGIAGKKAINA